MSRSLPPLDLHAHIDPSAAERDLEALGAVVFVATRSLDEYASVKSRTDAVTVWGVGCHPGVPEALEAFDDAQFADLLTSTPYVSEVGLDGSASTPIGQQSEVLAAVLAHLARTPRILSVHSRSATRQTLDLIEEAGVAGAVLHWWLGPESETRRALDLGCLFSVNRRMGAAALKGHGVPLTRLLPETDHPSGNRQGRLLKQPGWTVDIEEGVADVYGIPTDLVRRQFWRTLADQVDALDVASALFPPAVTAMLDQAKVDSRPS